MTSTGYAVLRWHRGDTIYEILEHRYLVGNPPGPVHHRNRVRDDNRPENIEPVGTPAAHGEHHQRIDRDAVIRLYREGLTTTAIANRLGANSGQVSRILKAKGEKARVASSYWERQIDADRVVSMHLDGFSSYAIAERLGVGQGVVMRHIKLLNLPRHKTGRKKGWQGELRR